MRIHALSDPVTTVIASEALERREKVLFTVELVSFEAK